MEFLSVSGDAAIGQASYLDVSLRRDRISAPLVQNAYITERRAAGRPFFIAGRNGRCRQVFGARRQTASMERKRFWMFRSGRYLRDGLAGRLSSTTRLTIRASSQNAGKSAHMTTDDSRSLYWHNRDSAQIRLETATETASDT